MTHHGNLGVKDRANHLAANTATFELYAVGPTSNQGRRVAHTVGHAEVVTQPGHVGHDVNVGLGRGDGAHVVAHLLDTDVKSVLVAEHHIGQRVPTKMTSTPAAL